MLPSGPIARPWSSADSARSEMSLSSSPSRYVAANLLAEHGIVGGHAAVAERGGARFVDEARDLAARAGVQLGDRARARRRGWSSRPRQPSFTGPSVLVTGTRTSVKKISLNSLSPVIVTSGRTSTPGSVMSTRRQVMPLCLGTSGSVRTRSSHQFDMWPSVFQVFCPFTIQVSPSSSAFVRSDARSEPALGSENPWHQMSSPRSMRGRRSRFCSSVPCSMIAGAMLERPSGLSVPGAWARCISSEYTTWSMTPAPRPPHSSGHAIAA